MIFTYRPCYFGTCLVSYSCPESDAFRTSKSISMAAETCSETMFFSLPLCVRFFLQFGTPWGTFWVPKLGAKTCTSQPWALWDASWRQLGGLEAALVLLWGPWGAIWPLPSLHLGPVSSILGSPGLHFRPSRASSAWIFGSNLGPPPIQKIWSEKQKQKAKSYSKKFKARATSLKLKAKNWSKKFKARAKSFKQKAKS